MTFLGAAVLSTVLAAGSLAPATASTAPLASGTPGAPVVSELTDSSATQQRWLSVPESRLVLNPYDFDGSGTELDQNSGAGLPVSNGFYAHDKAIRTTNILQTFVAPDAPPPSSGQEGDPSYRADFSTIGTPDSTWVHSGVDPKLNDDDSVDLTTGSSGDHWGYIAQSVTVDLSSAPVLTVDVPRTSGLWAVKVAAPGQADVALHAGDLSQTGSVSFDIAAKTGWTGTRTFVVKLFAVGTAGVASTTTYAGARIHSVAFPDEGTNPSFVDDFTTASTSRWNESSAGTTLVSNGSAAALTLPGSEWGYRAQKINVDLTENPLLSVRVLAGSGQWAIKVSRKLGGDGDITLQPDTTQSGVLSYDLAGVTGWTGTTEFYIKLFQVGKGKTGTQTTFDRLSVHPGSPWLASATDVASTWDPTKLTYTAEYAGNAGQIVTTDQFAEKDPDAFTRQVTSTLGSGSAVVAGPYSEGTRYDDQTHTIVSDGADASYAIALPVDAEVRFYESESALRFGRAGTASPSAASGYWAATLPQGGTSTIGIGWAIRDAAAPASAAASESAIAAIATGAPDRAAAHWDSFWNDYLARVPMVSDFSIQRVNDGGVTTDEMRHFYLQAWIGLEMNVLPATPETGNMFAQLGTGKPSMWMNGTPGTKNVASWDSLLGMQQLVFTDPENAWASFEGMMALVNDDVDPDAYEYGELGGESLPSRKAQTAWVLYQATGDRGRLESIYKALKLHLAWEKNNMRWVLGGHNYLDERDSEFVASLIFDLDFAAKIARELDHDEDAETWDSWVPELTENYQEWFFPATAGADGKTWSTVQKVYLDETRAQSPSADQGEAPTYRNEHGQWVDPGWSFYTSTALVIDDLQPQYRTKIRERFTDDYDEDSQLAGLGEFAIKAPDAQLLVYGLLDSGDASEIDEAEVIIQSLNRDMTLSGLFAEVYYATGEIGEPVGARGVRPSLFGISNLIDNVLLANGVRTSEGTPSFVRLAKSTGGVTGLSWFGERLDVDIDGESIHLSGDAVADPTICRELDAPVGKKLAISTCDDLPSNVSLTLSSSSVAPGDELVVSGEGFATSTNVAISLHSVPVELTVIGTDDTGAFRTTVRIPEEAALGAHTVVASDGTSEARTPLDVLESNTENPGDDGPDGAPAEQDGSLATTGGEITAWLVLAAIAALAGGAILRQRTRRASIRR